MNNLVVYDLSKDEIYTLMKEHFDKCFIESFLENKEDFHHNSDYEKTKRILQYGILSIEAGIREGLYDEKIQGIDNVNGREYISVSKDEGYDPIRDFYYDHRYPTNINFVIDEQIRSERRVMRNSSNYCNEFLIFDSIPLKYIKSIEVRFLKLVNLIGTGLGKISIDDYVKRYNYLIDMVCYMQRNGIDIPVVEASIDGMILDKQKLLSKGKMVK